MRCGKLLGLAGALLLCGRPWLAAAADRPPNIVHVVGDDIGDDIGCDDIGPFGAKDVPTPNLARLARQGMRLTRFYAPSPLWTPRRLPRS
jgi:arylsulfatase A-like enzyme